LQDGKTRAIQGESTQIYQKIQEAVQAEKKLLNNRFNLVACGKTLSANSEINNGMTITLVPELLGGAAAGGCPTGVDPAFYALALKKILDKKICRDCYGRNPVDAFTCRKRKCGHSANLRPKKAIK
jgi:ribosomal protein L40E